MLLFDDIIFGPVLSRRLGISLGLNLLTVNSKVCTFDCIYCECGWTKSCHVEPCETPSSAQVKELLEQKLQKMSANKQKIDSITFAGNGEPTLHPEFPQIINNTISLRNKYYPGTKVTVLSNASMINNENIINALKKVDNNMLKIDTAINETFHLLNKPLIKLELKEIISNLKKFNGDLIIQSLFVRAEINGRIIDNTTENEINEWLKVLALIKPRLVMIYPISREPAHKNVKKISKPELDKIAERVKTIGLQTEIYY